MVDNHTNPKAVCGFVNQGKFYVLFSDVAFPMVIGSQFINDYMKQSPENWAIALSGLESGYFYNLMHDFATRLYLVNKFVYYVDSLEKHITDSNLNVITSVPEGVSTYIIDLDNQIFEHKYNGVLKHKCGLVNVHKFMFNSMYADEYAFD
jgi:hypothetical protein